MSPQDARELLDATAPDGELWPLHCRQVARVSLTLGRALRERGADVDLRRLETEALLHDIGRSRTHGPYHGWSGFVMLRARGHGAAGRGCLTHWLKGRSGEELLRHGRFRPRFVERVVAAASPEDWDLADSVLSVADSSVRHTTVVSFDDRFADLYDRYGESAWMRRGHELTTAHAAHISEALGRPAEEVLAPLHGDTLE